MSILGVGFGNINWGQPFKAPSPVGKSKTALILALVVVGGVAGLLGIAFHRRRRTQYGQPQNEKQLSNIVTTFERVHHWNYPLTTDELKPLREGVAFVTEWVNKAKEKHSTSVFP